MTHDGQNIPNMQKDNSDIGLVLSILATCIAGNGGRRSRAVHIRRPQRRQR